MTDHGNLTDMPFTLEFDAAGPEGGDTAMDEDISEECPTCGYTCPVPSNIPPVYAFRCECGETGIVIKEDGEQTVRYDVQTKNGDEFLEVQDGDPVDLRICDQCNGTIRTGEHVYISGRTYLTQKRCGECHKVDDVIGTGTLFADETLTGRERM